MPEIMLSNLPDKGVGSALIDAMEARSRASGCERFVLDVSERNSNAQRLYERQGLEACDRWPRFAMIPPMIRRMAKPLDPAPPA